MKYIFEKGDTVRIKGSDKTYTVMVTDYGDNNCMLSGVPEQHWYGFGELEKKKAAATGSDG